MGCRPIEPFPVAHRARIRPAAPARGLLAAGPMRSLWRSRSPAIHPMLVHLGSDRRRTCGCWWHPGMPPRGRRPRRVRPRTRWPSLPDAPYPGQGQAHRRAEFARVLQRVRNLPAGQRVDLVARRDMPIALRSTSLSLSTMASTFPRSKLVLPPDACPLRSGIHGAPHHGHPGSSPSRSGAAPGPGAGAGRPGIAFLCLEPVFTYC